MRSCLLALIPMGAFALVAFLTLGPAARWNETASLWLQGPAELPLTIAGFFTDWLFAGPVVLIGAALTCLVLAVKRQWLLAVSASLIFPLVALEIALKYSVEQSPAAYYLQIRKLLPSSAGADIKELMRGFPSGHAARLGFVIGWLAVLLVPARFRVTALGATLVLAVFAAWTRLYVGDHSLLELAAGLLLSLAFLLPAWTLASLAKRQPAR